MELQDRRGKRQFQDDDAMKIEAYLTKRRGSDNDALKIRLEDPIIQERLRSVFLQQSTDEKTNIDNSFNDKIDKMEQSPKGHKKNDQKNKNEINRSSSLKDKTNSNANFKRTEKKSGHRRPKSENDFMKIIRDVSIERIKNVVKRSSSVKDEKLTEQVKVVKRSSSFKAQRRYGFIQCEDDEIPIFTNPVQRQRHTRTKSESEATTQRRITRSSSLLDNLVLKDATDALYGNSSKVKIERTRSASVIESITKTDKSMKEKLRSVLGRSNSFNESKESIHRESNKRSIKERLKNLVGRSSSFKNPEKEKAKFKRKRAGSESELFTDKSISDHLRITVRRSSSLKDKRDEVTECEDETFSNSLGDLTRNSVIHSSSTKDKSTNKRRLPAIVRRLSRQKSRKESDTEDDDISNNGEDNTSFSDLDQSTPTPSPSSSLNPIPAQVEVTGGNTSSRTIPSPRSRNKNETPRRVIKRNVSRSNSLQKKIDRKNYAKNRENSQMPSATPMTSRSMSVGDVLGNVKISTTPKNTSIRRQYSLREDRSVYMNKVSPSPMILHASHENLDCNANILIEIKNEIVVPKKKKGLLQPLRNHIRRRSLGRDEMAETKKYLKLDNTRLENIVTELLEEKMSTVEYDHKLSNDRCRLLSTCIENALKIHLDGERDYKILALVYIGEKRDHGICFATQCCYEPTNDLFATATYQNENMFVCACVFASLLPETVAEVVG